jgi:hypothetical protein
MMKLLRRQAPETIKAALAGGPNLVELKLG